MDELIRINIYKKRIQECTSLIELQNTEDLIFHVFDVNSKEFSELMINVNKKIKQLEIREYMSND